MLKTTKNPIVFILQNLATTITFVHLKLYVYTDLAQTNYEIIYLEAIPDAANKVVFYLQEYLEKRLSYDIPNWNGTAIQNCNNICKPYKIEYAFQNATTNYADLTFVDAGFIDYALLAGFEKDDFPLKNTSELPNDSIFLTTMPYMILDSSQKAFLYVMPLVTLGNDLIEFKVIYEDNTNHVQTITQNITQYQAFIIPIGFEARNYQAANPAKNIKQIDISIAGQTFSIETVSSHYLNFTQEIHWANSLGGFDSLVCTGTATQTVEASKDLFEHYKPYNYTNDFREIATYNHSKKITGKIRSGFLPKAVLDKIANDLLTSPLVFLRKDTKFLPINITSKAIQILQSDEFKYAFEISYEQ